MIRPPPLQLKLDNRFPHPVRTPSKPKSQSFASQLYKASWKNPIIAVAGLNGLRFAFAAYNAFEDAMIDDEEGAENLLKVSVALCVMYFVAFLIEIYGIIGVSMQRFGLVRVYLFLTFVASLLVASAGVLKGVAYFSFAEELMLECVSLAMEGRGSEKALFRSRPWPRSLYPLRQNLARRQCVNAWVHQSWYHVAAVFVFSVIPAAIYYALVYTYYRQTVDPGHGANLLHNKSKGSVRAGGESASYARVAVTSATGMSTASLHPVSAARRRVAARRALPQRAIRGIGASTNTGSSYSGSTASTSVAGMKRTHTYRSLQRSHRPPPLLQSPSPVGLTPGPPSYRPSRVYAAFAAPVPSDGEYDKFV